MADKMPFDTDKFILEIKRRPALWNTGCPEHADRALKLQCWEELVDIFKEKEDLKVIERKDLADTLQKKWKGIRGCFTRELKRQRILKTGSDGGPRKNPYVYFQQLQFLKYAVAIKEPDPVTTQESNSGASEDSQEATAPPEPAEVIESKRMRLQSPESQDEESSETPNKSIENTETFEIEADYQDEDKLFLMSLLSTLKRVPSQIKLRTKIKIMSVLEEATQFVVFKEEEKDGD